jgi:hypothetical protein
MRGTGFEPNPSPVPPVRLDDLRRRLFDPDEADPFELHHLSHVEGDHRLAVARQVPVRLVKDAGDGMFRREPLDDGGLRLHCLVRRLAGVSPLWGGPIPAQPSDESYFGMVITSMR